MKATEAKRGLLFLAWAGVTFYFCQQNGEQSGALSGWLAETLYPAMAKLPVDFATFHFLLRKGAHFGMHFVLATLTYYMLRATVLREKIAAASAACLAIAGGLAIIDELVQVVAANRGARLADALINLAGVLAGTAFWHIYLHGRKKA